MNKNAVNWFEIPVADFDRAKTFYSNIFAYEMPEMPMPSIRMGILPHDRDSGGIGGAIVHGDGNAPKTGGVRVYLNASNFQDDVLNRIEQAGGRIVIPKTHIGEGMGYYSVFEDTEGNQVGLHSDN